MEWAQRRYSSDIISPWGTSDLWTILRGEEVDISPLVMFPSMLSLASLPDGRSARTRTPGDRNRGELYLLPSLEFRGIQDHHVRSYCSVAMNTIRVILEPVLKTPSIVILTFLITAVSVLVDIIRNATELFSI